MKFQLAKPLSIHELGQRKNQEDCIFPKQGGASKDDRLFVVCDGMGGHESGEIASATVCQVLSQEILKKQEGFKPVDFTEALDKVYDKLDSLDNGAEKKMGTTMTCVKFHDHGVLIAHIGDSRIYLIRPKTKQIIYKSRDHSLVNDLYEVGAITQEQMETFPQKNVITRAIQPKQQVRAVADIQNIQDIQKGDIIYMCTDGMLEQTQDNHILNILSDTRTSDIQKIEILEATSQNNQDNHSAYLIRVTDIEQQNKDNGQPVKSKSKLKIILIIILLTALLVGAYLLIK